MKRIANDVSVTTLLCTMHPQSLVKIADVDYNQFISKVPYDDPGSFGLTYRVDEVLHDYKLAKIAKSKICQTRINEGMLLLIVDTKHDVY